MLKTFQYTWGIEAQSVRGTSSFTVVGEEKLRLFLDLSCSLFVILSMHVATPMASLLKLLAVPVQPLSQVVIRQHGPSFCCLREIEFLCMITPLSYFTLVNYLYNWLFLSCVLLPLSFFPSTLFCPVLSFPFPFLFFLIIFFFSFPLPIPITSV